MPVTLIKAIAAVGWRTYASAGCGAASLRIAAGGLRIELVNNMPDAAVLTTQRQFIRLLEEGGKAFDVSFGLMTLHRSSDRTRRGGKWRSSTARRPTSAPRRRTRSS